MATIVKDPKPARHQYSYQITVSANDEPFPNGKYSRSFSGKTEKKPDEVLDAIMEAFRELP